MLQGPELSLHFLKLHRHCCAVNQLCIITETNLIDVELGDSCVEQKIEFVKHRDDLHRSTFTGQCSERHNVGEINGRLGEQFRFNVCSRLQFLSHASV